MKVSVITVCYNSAQTLARSLQSVAEQDWTAIEHIVIDGASTDETREIIERGWEHITYFLSEPDHGIYDAMNKGLERATGDIICFLNADDHYAHSQVLSQVVARMIEFELDALIADVGYFRKNQPQRMIRHYRSNKFNPDRLTHGWMPAHPALFLRKEVIQRVGSFKTNYRIAGDFEFIVRAFHDQNLRYRHFSEILVHMQTGGISAGGIHSKVLLNLEVLRACRENGLKTNIFKILSKYSEKFTEILIK